MASAGAPADATRILRRRHWIRHPAVLLPAALLLCLLVAIGVSWGTLIWRQAILIRLVETNNGTLIVHRREWLPERYESRLPKPAGRLIMIALEGPTITEREAALIHGLPDLEFLMLANARVSGRTLRGLPKLDYLRLYGSDIDDESLDAIVGQVPSITRIDVWNTAVGDAGVAALARLPRITDLQLGGTQITDDGLAALFRHPEIGSLGISYTNVGDGGLRHLHALTKLSVLDLRQTRITAAGLAHLKALGNLRMLYIDAEADQDDATQPLRQALPHCIISVDYHREDN
jgi:hypothetical protein